MVGDRMAVDGYQQSLEARREERTDLLRQEPAIGDQGRPYAGSTRVLDQADDFGMQQRLAALKGQIADAAAVQDRQCSHERGAVDPATVANDALVPCIRAEIAGRVADVCDGNVTHRRDQMTTGRCSSHHYPAIETSSWTRGYCLRSTLPAAPRSTEPSPTASITRIGRRHGRRRARQDFQPGDPNVRPAVGCPE